MGAIEQLRELLDEERTHGQGPGSLKHYKDDWIAALQRLTAKCREWLAPLGSRLTITTSVHHFDEVLGELPVEMLTLTTPGGVALTMAPVGRFPVEMGRVDLRSPSGYRLLTRVGTDEWVISPDRQPLTAETFVGAILELRQEVLAMVNEDAQ